MAEMTFNNLYNYVCYETCASDNDLNKILQVDNAPAFVKVVILEIHSIIVTRINCIYCPWKGNVLLCLWESGERKKSIKWWMQMASEPP